MDGWDKLKANILRLVRSRLRDESHGRWVMIVDNADDLSVFFPLPDKPQAVGNDIDVERLCIQDVPQKHRTKDLRSAQGSQADLTMHCEPSPDHRRGTAIGKSRVKCKKVLLNETNSPYSRDRPKHM